MKFLLFYRLAFVALLSPLALMASVNNSIGKPVKYGLSGVVVPMFQDTTVARKKPSNKPQEVQRPPQDVQEERLKEAQRREIKQVPRSIPKLKPQPVTERVKIRRPPMKVPKKGMGGYRF